MFFASVCPLVSTTASPKQPQSGTGFFRYIHTVSAVIAAMKRNVMRVVSLRRMPSRM